MMQKRLISHRSFQGWVHEDLALPESVLGALDVDLQPPQSELVLDCYARLIHRVNLDFGGQPCKCFVHQFRNTSWRRTGRTPAAYRIERIAELIGAKGILTIKVLGALHRRGQVFGRDSILIALEIPDVFELPSRGRHEYRVHPQVELTDSLVEAVGRSVADLHSNFFYHGDLKSRHVLVPRMLSGTQGFYFVDLEKSCRLRYVPSVVADLLSTKDLVQLMTSLRLEADFPGLASRFLTSYFLERQVGDDRRRRMQSWLALYTGDHFRQGSTFLDNIIRYYRRRYNRETFVSILDKSDFS